MRFKYPRKFWQWIVVLFAAISSTLNAELKVASPFTEHMVLQRDTAVPVWGQAEPGAEVTVAFASQSATTTAKADGKWRLDLQPLPANTQPDVMSITTPDPNESITINDVLVGDVWICSGQSNMNMGYQAIEDIKALEANAKNIRSFHVKNNVAFEEQDTCQGSWTKTPPPSAVAFAFAHFLEQAADVPIGIIQTSWGSSSIEAWMPRDMTESLPHFKTIMEEFDANQPTNERIQSILEGPKPWSSQDDVFLRRQPNILYNAMMSPLAPFACQGIVWYQGERQTKSMYGMLKEPWFARTSGMLDYGNVLQKWILRYREEWQRPDLEFLIVMLPGYGNILDAELEDTIESPNVHSWAWMRESQLQALELPHTAVANTIDLGDAKNVHPSDKLPIGERLALLAARDTLGQDIEAQGPTLKNVKQRKNTLVVSFEHSDGLKTTDNQPPSGFWIADNSENWIPADAKIVDEKVVLSAPEIKKPLYVRYAFAAKPTVNLVNKKDLPAFPFRTDRFDP